MTSTRPDRAAEYPAHLCRTKPDVTRKVLPRLLELAPDGDWLGLGCGSGSIEDELAKEHPAVAGVDILDVAELRAATRLPPQVWPAYQADYLLDDRLKAVPWSAVISNPSFTLPGKSGGRYDPEYDGVLRTIERGLELAPVVAVLHRSSWYHEPQKERVAFRKMLRANYLTERIVIGRTQFYGGGGDSTTYAWLVVSPGSGRATMEYDV